MSESTKDEKEAIPSTVVNEDEETDHAVEIEKGGDKGDEDNMEVGTGEEDNDMDDGDGDDGDKDEEEQQETSTPHHGRRGYGGRYQNRGYGRGGRGGRHARRHVPYRNNYDNENSSSSDRTRRVYVGNLSWNVTWQELKDYMKSAGCEVTRADVMTTHDGRSKGCGIVEFATEEGAKRAVLTLNDTELNGRQIFVREDREDGFGGRGGGSASDSNRGEKTTFKSEDSEDMEDSGETGNRRVYVGNLSWDVTWQDLKDHMREAGDVLYAEVLTEHDGRSKGCGIVEYSDASEAQEAIDSLNDSDLKGRMIFVREDREYTKNAPKNTRSTYPRSHQNTIVNPNVTSVYVGNLSFECSWQDLKDHMRAAGNVESANVLSSEDGRSKGCGIVIYQKPQEAQRAIRELQNTILHGRPIFIREDREQSNSSYHSHHRHNYHHNQNSHQDRNSHALQLFVGNLSYDTNWHDLKDHFRQCGEVDRAEVMEGPDGRKRGYGTVRFYKGRDAQNAIRQLNGADFMGRRLEVRIDHKAD